MVLQEEPKRVEDLQNLRFNIFICAGEKEDIVHVCLYVNGHLWNIFWTNALKKFGPHY